MISERAQTTRCAKKKKKRGRFLTFPYGLFETEVLDDRRAKSNCFVSRNNMVPRPRPYPDLPRAP